MHYNAHKPQAFDLDVFGWVYCYLTSYPVDYKESWTVCAVPQIQGLEITKHVKACWHVDVGRLYPLYIHIYPWLFIHLRRGDESQPVISVANERFVETKVHGVGRTVRRSFFAALCVACQDHDLCFVLISNILHRFCMSHQQNADKTLHKPSFLTTRSSKDCVCALFVFHPLSKNCGICTMLCTSCTKNIPYLRGFTSARNITKTHETLQKLYNL